MGGEIVQEFESEDDSVDHTTNSPREKSGSHIVPSKKNFP